MIAIIAIFYSRNSAKEAETANKFSGLNATLALREHYIKRMKDLDLRAKAMEKSESALKSIYKDYGDYDTKLREVNKELEKYHTQVIS